MKKLTVDSSVCAGCRACMMACSGEHYQKFSHHLSRIEIVKFEDKGVDVPVICRQCSNAPCIKACPVEALYKSEETGATLVSEEKCIGCGLCVEACPFAAMKLDLDNKAMVCDLCNGLPKCVEVCPVHAIKFEEMNKVAQKKRVSLAEKETGKVLAKWGIKGEVEVKK